jgi:chromosome partitioning protein
MKVVATYSIKGGVGKTTSAVNLSYEAARTGSRVLIWDLDPQGAATFFLRVKPKLKGGASRLIGAKGQLEPHLRATDVPGLDVLPADFSLRHLDLHLDSGAASGRRLAELLEPLADHYDLAVLDCPPGMTLTSENVFGAVDALLVPTVPSTLSARTLDQLAAFLATQETAPLVLPFCAMVDRRKRLHRDLVERLTKDWPELLPIAIPSSAAVERMGVERAPVAAFAPRGAAAVAYRELWEEVAARLWLT